VKPLAWILAAAAALAGAAWWLHVGRNLSQALAAHGLDGAFEDFRIKRESTSRVAEKTVVEILGVSGGAELRAVIVPGSLEAYAQYSGQKTFELLGQFQRGDSPYPGFASKAQACPPEFLPRMDEAQGRGWSGTLMRAPVNTRGLAGVCRPEEHNRDAYQLILLCRDSGTIFDLTIFVRPNDEDELRRLKSVACREREAAL